jgi:hypothetical protein
MPEYFHLILDKHEELCDLCKHISNPYTTAYYSIITINDFLNNYFPNKKLHKFHIKKTLLHINNDVASRDFSFGDIMRKNILFEAHQKIKKKCKDILLFIQKYKKYEKCAYLFVNENKYFAILVNKKNYYVRDCASDAQYNFTSFETFFKYFMKMYNGDLIMTAFLFINKIRIVENFNIDDDDIFDLPKEYLFSSEDIKHMKMLNNIVFSEFKKKQDQIDDNDLVLF